MKNKKKCIFNWSGGKDSTLALHHILQDPSIEIKYLVTTVNDEFNRVSMHGVRESLLIKQAESIGIPLYQIRLSDTPDMESYDKAMHIHLSKFKNEGITHSIFGDIFLDDLRNYRENKLNEVGLKALFPLWKRSTKDIINEFLDLNYKTIIVCTQQNLKSFCGEIITNDLISKLPSDIDPCGENGEFHTFAFEGPIFKNNINFTLGEKVFRTYAKPKISGDNNEICKHDQSTFGFWYADLLN